MQPSVPDDRVALVTGGSRGIGAAVVRLLAARGVRTAFTYLRAPDSADSLATEFPGLVQPIRYELGDLHSAEAAVEQVVATFGRLDTLVANAGVWDGGLLTRIDMDTWARVVTDNVVGTAQICRAAIPALEESTGDRSITIVSSVVGQIGGAGDSAYASAKAALLALNRTLAQECGQGQIRVNAVAPGFVETDMTASLPEGSARRVVDQTLLGRPGRAGEIAGAIAFLALDATYCTGSTLTVDGGWSL
ncbi:MAG TPA: SDR family oxidoreductase [Nocardioidaceae bacterium]|nr:SDR family oxidoreductase [Nocardioidaceae bacterium]